MSDNIFVLGKPQNL